MTGGAGDQITEAAVLDLVRDWFAALDRHDDVEVLLDLLAQAGLVMHLPEGTVRGHDDFRSWYGENTNTYFDEVREVLDMTVTATSPLHAEVSLRVNWQSRMWAPPAPNSAWIGLTTTQTWSVVLCDGRPKIRTCTVGGSTPMPGSAAPRATESAHESAAA
ncbi:nuclear transport factor 2 family protein [Actinosynnema sp. NPDC050801]|uniref:nuclear transport factor 2 family protein n=1 Tax=unclassified Actinosynnema TaxID=2637065 RepID=UPI0033C13B70